MKLNVITIIIAFSTSLALQCSENIQLTIRPATLNDLDAIFAISQQYYAKNFKPLWTKHYAPNMPLSHNIDHFAQEKLTAANIANKDFITKQVNNQNYRLLVAEIATLKAPTTIAGYCRFEKNDAHKMYINFIVVDESFRNRGIAKQLAHAAMNTFDDVTECNFRALAHNDFVNDLYTKYGCINKGTISLDLNTGKVSMDPTMPITHIDYSYTIKK